MEDVYALIISDLHLGSSICRADKILKLFDLFHFEKLVINGDLIDSHNLTRFHKLHWKVLSKIRKFTKEKQVVFINGNHDGDLGIISCILGLEFVSDYSFTIGPQSYYLVHGDKFDGWMNPKYKWFTDFFVNVYYYIQKFDTQHNYFSSKIKKLFKKHCKIHQSLNTQAINFAVNQGYNNIILGHTHIPDFKNIDGVNYINCGSFCDSVCTFVVIKKDGSAELKSI